MAVTRVEVVTTTITEWDENEENLKEGEGGTREMCVERRFKIPMSQEDNHEE